MIEFVDGNTELVRIDEENKNLLSRDLTGYTVKVEIRDKIESHNGFGEFFSQIEEKFFDLWKPNGKTGSYIRCYLINKVPKYSDKSNEYIGVIVEENIIIKFSIVTLDEGEFNIYPKPSIGDINFSIFGFYSGVHKTDDVLSTESFRLLISDHGGSDYIHYLRNEFKSFEGAKFYNLELERKRKKDKIQFYRERIDKLRDIRRTNPLGYSELMYWKEIEYLDKIQEIKSQLFDSDTTRHNIEDLWLHSIRWRIENGELSLNENEEVSFTTLDGKEVQQDEIRINDLFFTVNSHMKFVGGEKEQYYQLNLYKCHWKVDIDYRSDFAGHENGILQSCEHIDSLGIFIDDKPLKLPVEEYSYDENNISQISLSFPEKYKLFKKWLQYLK